MTKFILRPWVKKHVITVKCQTLSLTKNNCFQFSFNIEKPVKELVAATFFCTSKETR